MSRAKKKSRPAKRSEYFKGNAFDRIKNFYMGKISDSQLTDKEKILKWRYENVWLLYQHHQKTSVAINNHVATCKVKGYEIDKRTAWRDFEKAKKLWGVEVRGNIESKLMLMDEMATEAFLAAREKKNVLHMNRAVKNLITVNKQLNKLHDEIRTPHKYELHLHLNEEHKILNLNRLPVNNSGYKEVLQSIEKNEMNEDTFNEHLDEADY